MEFAGRLFNALGIDPKLPVQEKLIRSIIPVAGYTTFPLYGLSLVDDALRKLTGQGLPERTQTMYDTDKPRPVNAANVNYMPGMGSRGFGDAF